MKKIESLTKQQEQDLIEFRQKALEVGLSTEPANFEVAERIIKEFYRRLEKPEPEIIKVSSPLEAEKLINKAKGNKAAVYNGTYFWGQQDNYWIAFYQFCEQIGVKYTKDQSKLLEQWSKLAKSCGWVYFYEKAAIICDRPEFVSMKDGRLHNEGKMAIKYRDGWGIYALNGIRVPAYVIETPKEKLDVKKILGEQNVDIRREALKLIPVERLLKDTNSKLLDEWKDDRKAWCDYKLYSMDFGDGVVRKVLCMKNPSLTNTYHYERVEDTIETCKAALAWRMNLPNYLEPIILT